MMMDGYVINYNVVISHQQSRIAHADRILYEDLCLIEMWKLSHTHISSRLARLFDAAARASCLVRRQKQMRNTDAELFYILLIFVCFTSTSRNLQAFV